MIRHRIKGSKYVQSSLGLCFGAIKKDLQQGIAVLFVGTPCQCAGLKAFLNKDYDKLYLVDFVCHGVPSQKILTDAIKYNLMQGNLQGYEVKFRYRSGKNEHSIYGLQLIKDGVIKYQKNWPNNDYITGFLSGVFYRDSCYICKYATPKRITDITLGDFWDREYEKTISKDALGLSSVICNTEKGKNLIDIIQNHINIELTTKDILVQSNSQLRKPFVKPVSFNRFRSVYSKKGYGQASNKVLQKEIKKTKRAMLKNRIAKKIKKFLPFLK